MSDRSLRNFRQFYLAYPQINQALLDFALPGSIWQTVSAKSGKELKHANFKDVDPGLLLAKLSFSHVIELMGEEDPMKRIFYEVEAIKGNWSVLELK